MGAIRLAGKVIFWLVAGILTFLVFLYLSLIAINFVDQEPSQAALRLSTIFANRPAVSDESNAYVFVYGFSTDRSGNPVSVGQQHIDWLRKMSMRPGPEFFDELPGDNFDRSELKLFGLTKLFSECRAIDSVCLGLLQNEEASLQKTLKENVWLLERYQNLLDRHDWVETVPFDFRMPLPDYSSVFTAQILLFIQSWIAAGNGDVVTVKTLLDRDVGFWRNVLMSSDLLITKMIATAAIGRNLSWGSAVLGRLPADRMTEAVPDGWHLPISEDEYSMLRCMVGEWEFSGRTMEQQSGRSVSILRDSDEPSSLDAVLSFLVEPLFKSQDTRNLYADLILEILDALDVPYPQYPQAIEDALDRWNDRDYLSFPGILYNPIGKLLFAFPSWDFSNYFNRVRDLEGLRRASLVAVQLRTMAVDAKDVAALLTTIGIYDPYTEEPFSWDDRSGAIVFRGLEKDERGRHLILY